MPYNITCPFCGKEEPGSFEQHNTHFATCSGDTRKTFSLQVSRADSSLEYYNFAKANLSDRISRSGLPKRTLDINVIQVLRMWRANEKAGKTEYLAQLMALSLQFIEEKERNAAKQLLIQVLGGWRYPASRQFVMAIEKHSVHSLATCTPKNRRLFLSTSRPACRWLSSPILATSAK